MNEFESNREYYKNAKRGTYIIFPLKYYDKLNLKNIEIDNAESCDFKSDDISDLLIQKCKEDNGFVRSFILKKELNSIKFDDGQSIPVEQLQLFIFKNGIAFLSALLIYENNHTQYVYEFINPGYVNDQKDDLRKDIITEVQSIRVNGQNSIFKMYVGTPELAIKESYLFNVAIVNKRFKQLETLERVTFNAHKIIDLSLDFEDTSEKDIAYTYGARDVDNKTYRWGACISSQSISYVYAIERIEDITQNMIDTSKDDFLLTILVLHQKNTCMLLNEEIQDTISKTSKKYFFTKKKIKELKKEAIEFKASDTLAPSQVSRWYNVCETYRHLLNVNGVYEALEEIEQKVDLINEEQKEKSTEIQNYVATVIAVFGLISIVASVLTIVDFVSKGTAEIFAALRISCTVVALFVFSWLIILFKKK